MFWSFEILMLLEPEGILSVHGLCLHIAHQPFCPLLEGAARLERHQRLVVEQLTVRQRHVFQQHAPGHSIDH